MKSKQTIVVVSGPLGVGKSTLCRLISTELGYHHVNGDAFFGPLEKQPISWGERLRRSWEWIVQETKKQIDTGKSVVIDFVVENELPWFKDEVSDLEVTIRYVVLIADIDQIKQRLIKRDGGLQYFSRSELLLDQLKNDPANQKYLLDSSRMTSAEVFDHVMNEDRFELK